MTNQKCKHIIFVVFMLAIGFSARAEKTSTPQDDFDANCRSNEKITPQNLEDLLANRWKGTFKVQLQKGQHVLWKDACSGSIEVQFLKLPGPESEFRPAATAKKISPPPEIAYRFTPDFEECLKSHKLAKVLDKLDRVNVASCHSSYDFRTVHISTTPGESSAIYSPKCKRDGSGVRWTALPAVPTICKKKDGSKLWLEVAFKGLPIRVFYDLPADVTPSATTGGGSEATPGKGEANQ